MDFIVSILGALGLFPAKDLSDSMHRSKILTAMVIAGFILFGCFIAFLFYMAGKQ